MEVDRSRQAGATSCSSRSAAIVKSSQKRNANDAGLADLRRALAGVKRRARLGLRCQREDTRWEQPSTVQFPHRSAKWRYFRLKPGLLIAVLLPLTSLDARDALLDEPFLLPMGK